MLKIFLTFFLVSFSFFVKAELRIDITQGNTEPTPLALLQFNSKNLEEEKISFDINLSPEFLNNAPFNKPHSIKI